MSFRAAPNEDWGKVWERAPLSLAAVAAPPCGRCDVDFAAPNGRSRNHQNEHEKPYGYVLRGSQLAAG
eukprot:scaffold1231_cov187-Pinguiococcus_pyrenoidosus.AAC.14